MGPVAFCNNCGHRNPPEANFCSSCGAVLDTGANADTTVTLRPVDVLGEPGDDELTVSLPERADTGLLVIKHGPNAGTRFVLDAPAISVGRHPESGIFLDDITVSRRHAEFRQEDGGYVVAVNPTLADAPEQVNTDPYGSGWLCELAPSDAQATGGLLDADAYRGLVDG